MRLVVHRTACLKSGQCTYLHPDLFREDPDGYPEVLVEQPEGEALTGAEEAIEICPGQAIALERDASDP